MDNIDIWINDLLASKPLPEAAVVKLCECAVTILLEEPNVLRLSGPIQVCGDIHGHFPDLLQVFHKFGLPPAKSYLFLGNYVNRGWFSAETIELLLCLKVKYPSSIALLRGNHEDAQITKIYGFYDEIMKIYGTAVVYNKFVEVFNFLPLAAIINSEIFCVHAGLSPEFSRIGEIDFFERPCSMPAEGLLCDIMWSEPDEIEGWGIVPRGAAYIFGFKVVNDFHYVNGTRLIARGHKMVQEGYEYLFDKKLVTIFSAPNYAYRCDNKGAIMFIDSHGNESLQTYGTVFDFKNEDSKKNLDSVPLIKF